MLVVPPWSAFRGYRTPSGAFRPNHRPELRTGGSRRLLVAVLFRLAATAESRDHLVARDLRERRKEYHDRQLHPPLVDAQLPARLAGDWPDLPEPPPCSSLQIAQIEVQPIERGSRLMCGEHHDIDKLEQRFPAEVGKWRDDLHRYGASRVINIGNIVVPSRGLRKSIQQRSDSRGFVDNEQAFDSLGALLFHALSLQGEPQRLRQRSLRVQRLDVDLLNALVVHHSCPPRAIATSHLGIVRAPSEVHV